MRGGATREKVAHPICLLRVVFRRLHPWTKLVIREHTNGDGPKGRMRQARPTTMPWTRRKTGSHDTLTQIRMRRRDGHSSEKVERWSGTSMVGGQYLCDFETVADQSRKPRRDTQNQRRAAHRNCKEGQRHLQRNQTDKRCHPRLSLASQRVRCRVSQGEPARLR